MNKLVILIIVGLLSIQPTFSQKNAEWKVNGLSALLLMPHIGLESQLGRQTSMQVDVFASFWKDVNGHPYQNLHVYTDFRYYPNSRSLLGWYVAPHAGVGIYNTNNHFSYPDGFRQEGIFMAFGGTVGYKTRISYNIGLEFFFGAGWSHSRFNTYSPYQEGPVDSEGRGYDLSSKWKPQRFGIMITYSLYAVRRWND